MTCALEQQLKAERAAREQAEARLVEAIEILKRWDSAFRAHMQGVRLYESASLFLSSTTPLVKHGLDALRNPE